METGVISGRTLIRGCAILNAMEFKPRQRRAALRAFMEREGLKSTPWETASDVGEGTVRKYLKSTGEEALSERILSKLAAGASALTKRPVTIREMQEAPGDAPRAPTERQTLIHAPALPARDNMSRDIPVLGTTLAGSEGDFQMNSGEPIDFIRRPAHLAGRANVLALYVQGTSMWPWKKPGQLVVVDSRPVQIGDRIVVELRPIGPDDERPAFLKELLAVTSTKIRLGQYKPAKEFEIDRRRVHKMWRVMESEELLGF